MSSSTQALEIRSRLLGDKARVLLYEPHAGHAALVRDALVEGDIRVELVVDSPAATQSAKDAAFDLWILSDAAGGLPLLRALRKENAHTPAILMSARGESAGVEALQSGASDFVHKVAGFESILPALVRQSLLREAAVHALAPRLLELTRQTDQAEHARASLQQQLVTQNLELHNANRRAREASSQRSHLLASVSHELRTPLTTILGFTGVLLDRASGPLTADQDKQLELIKNASTQLLALINDVLDLARLESGQTELVSLPVDLHALLKDCAAPLTHLIEGRAVVVRILGAPVTVQTDPTRVRQILWNLCLSASRNTTTGHIELAVASEPQGARVTVTDTSPGMSVEEQQVLFEKFPPNSAAKRKTRTGNAAAGLGLPLAADLARALGGTLQVESQVGQGTVFSLRLPLVMPPVAKGGPAFQPPLAPP